ncbi:MAG: outer membrane protein assembly factor BamD [Schleiferiaceae bacterium]|nr:outer membrane protein assembly factor BamD [Schleiferiaceae bacterium]
MNFRSLLVVLLLVVLASCSEYQKILKSTDLDMKFRVGKEYFEKERYDRAYPIFDELITLYRGTNKAEEVYYYYASTLFGMKDYILAAYHFKNYAKTFPNSARAEEAAYMTAYCYYLEAPEYSLDQGFTYKAINELQLYINRYPNSSRVETGNRIMRELRGKLERKQYEIAKNYYRTENYQSAVVSLGNTLNDFPDTKYREEAMYLRLMASFKLAENSIDSKKKQRYREAMTNYYNFVDFFPDSKNRKEAEEILDKVKEQYEQLNTTIE